MNSETPEVSRPRLLLHASIRLGTGTAIFAAMLFLAAGSVDWPMAWGSFNEILAPHAACSTVLIRLIVGGTFLSESIQKFLFGVRL